jgi:para-aminobenzoate synthetase component 1
VRAELRAGVGLADILRATFPMGSMTGAPKIRAMQLIEHYENTRRGLYSGSLGYVLADGDFTFNVVIRSLQYRADTGYLSLQVGSAITYDSVAEHEYEECLLKAQGVLQALNTVISEQ